MKKIKEIKHEVLTLSPKIVENEINDKYIKKIDDLLDIKDCKNIALVGNYGSGKSSLIKTFLYKRKEYSKKTLTVTIGSYITDNDISDNQVNTKEQILVNRVEESILKQIIYRKKASKFPKSTLIRFDKENWLKKFIYTLAIIYTIWFSCFYYFKIYEEKQITIEKLFNYFGIHGLIMFGILVFLISKIVKIIINKVKINKIKIKDCEMDLHQDTNSLFSRYLSEIIYYFQITKYKLVVFEDLDRFPNDIALKVIQELKELNTILNNSYGIKKVVFIYAVKDNLFDKVEDKNKFYDYNLSILPISTTFNSELNLVGLLKQENVYVDFSSNLISIVSKHIYDMRTLINIVNDYCLFKDITNTKNYDKLFAMVTFKNYYYKEYNLMSQNEDKDIIKQALNSIEEKKKELIMKLTDDKTNIYEQISNIENDAIKSKNELKQLLLSYNATSGYDGRAVTHYYINDGTALNISEFLSDGFDMEQLVDNNFSLKRYDGRINERDVFSRFESKEMFLERYNSIDSDSKIEELKQSIDKINKQIEKIRTSSISDIFKKYFAYNKLENNSEKNKQLLYDLIQNDYIMDDYMDYITSPVIYGDSENAESLLYSDSKFLMDFRQEKYSYDTKLVGFKTILDRIKDDLNSPYALNYDLLNYLIDNKESLNKYIESFFSQFKELDSIKIKFIIEFFKRHLDKVNYILELFLKNKYDVWSSYIKNINDMTIDDGLFLAKNILCQKDYIKIIENISSLKEFFEDKISMEENNLNKILSNDCVRENLLLIKPRLNDISILNNENFLFVYENNLYSFDEKNLFKIVEDNIIDLEKVKTDDRFQKLYNYIKDNLEIFCDEYYIIHKETLSLQELINTVINSEIKLSIKKEVYSREKFKLRNINNVEKELYVDLILYDHLNINWKNILDLYKQVENNILFEYVSKNLNKLLNKSIPDEDKKKIESFFKKYILYLIEIDLKNSENVIQLYTPKYEQINNITKEECILLIKYNCILFNKFNYRYILKLLNKEERYVYVLNYFNNNNKITEIVNTILLEDLELLLISDGLSNDQKMELMYGIYKKEKRINEENAIELFINRLKISFKENVIHQINYNKTIYNAILKKLKQNETFKSLEINDEKINFKL